jgi:hypothetical protein
MVIFLLLIGCTQKEGSFDISTKPLIEIYLPKERIKSYDGSKIMTEWNFSETLKTDTTFIIMNEILLEYGRYDSITNKTIYAGSFEASQTDLPQEPLIKDDEILSFNFNTSKLTLSSSAVKKLWCLKSDFLYSQQFVITANRQPILTGYLFNVLSSSTVNHFYITYTGGYGRLEMLDFNDEEFEIQYNPNTQFIRELETYDFKLDKEFYSAFKKSGKIEPQS